MKGAIIGDIVGSRWEFNNIFTKDFQWLDRKKNYFTDDTVMTVAVADAVMKWKESGTKDYEYLRELAIESMQIIGENYPRCGFGGRFIKWIFGDAVPLDSCGNGSAMRVSSVAWFADSLAECIEMAKAVTDISHNHPEGIKGAVCTAVCIYGALHGATKSEIKKTAMQYYPDFKDEKFTVDEIRKTYWHNELSQYTVPQAIQCFLESKNYEEAIRNCISIGGDSDTLGAICGGIAEAFYKKVKGDDEIEWYLDYRLNSVVDKFDEMISKRKSE